MAGKYDDIIHLPHKQSAARPHMSVIDRAAQFSPFAALTGHGDAIKETERLTGRKMELDEHSKEALDMRLQMIMENLSGQPELSVTYFLPDAKKAGGEYVTLSGTVKRIDEVKQLIIMRDGTIIPIDDVVGIEGDILRGLGDV